MPQGLLDVGWLDTVSVTEPLCRAADPYLIPSSHPQIRRAIKGLQHGAQTDRPPSPQTPLGTVTAARSRPRSEANLRSGSRPDADELRRMKRQLPTWRQVAVEQDAHGKLASFRCACTP